MRRIWIRLVAACALLLGLAVSAQAAPAPQQGSAPGISEFTSSAAMIDRTALAGRKALIPVRWVAVNRPDNSNLVFEQLLPDGRVMNVELPRDNPLVVTAGDGVVQPFPPGGDATTVTFQVRLIDLNSGRTYGLRQLTLPIGDVPPPDLSIRIFSTTAAEVIRAQLNARTARVPVSWQVDNRPEGSNLVFEQILEDGSAVNVELPRQNPIVASSGQGVAAPIAPQNAATTSITLRLSVAMLNSGALLATKEITLPISDAPTLIPAISVFSTTARDVNRGQLSNRTARVPVAWQVDNRPNNSNLVFEQLLPDNRVVNVELPRSNPFVASSGVGVAAPVLPDGAASSIQLRVRLIDLSTNTTLTQRELTLPINDQQIGPVISSFTTTAGSVNRAQLAARTARVPVSWSVENRPANTNLVFEQVLANNSVVNVELPRQALIVPSAGDGVAAPVLPGGSNTAIQLRLRLVDLTTQATLAQQSITLPISDAPPAASIRAFGTSAASVDLPSLATGAARLPVSWLVDNRAEGSNLAFEQVLDDGAVINVELPRQNPFVASSGNGVVAPVAPRYAYTTSITLRLRVFNIGSGTLITQKEISVPIREAGGASFFQDVPAAQCSTANGFPADVGLSVGATGRVKNVPASGLPVSSAPRGGQPLGTLAAGATFTVVEGPYCYRALYTSTSSQLRWRLWKVRASASDGTLEGWVHEYSSPQNTVTSYLEPAAGGTSGGAITGDIAITSFTAEPAMASRSATITLRWTTSGPVTRVSIGRFNELSGAYEETIFDDQPASGAQSYALPAQYLSAARFTLSAFDASGRETTRETSVSIACAFTETLIAGCPLAQDTAVNAAYQPFEKGFMVWRGDTRSIYLFFDDGTWQVLSDTWAEGDPDVSAAPPAGLFAPLRGFGKVWSSIGGLALLGWATAEEVSYVTQWEVFPYWDGVSQIDSQALTLPDGRVIQADSAWRVVQQR